MAAEKKLQPKTISLEVTDRWDDLLEEIDTDQIPLDVISKIVIILTDGERVELDIKEIRNDKSLQGSKLEKYVEMYLKKYHTKVQTLDIELDIQKLAETVETTTDKILKE